MMGVLALMFGPGFDSPQLHKAHRYCVFVPGMDLINDRHTHNHGVNAMYKGLTGFDSMKRSNTKRFIAPLTGNRFQPTELKAAA